MTDLPTNDPLSGPPGPPFFGVNPSPSTVGTVTIYSTEIQGPSGNKVIGPLPIALTQMSTDEVLDLVFDAATSVTIVSPPNGTLMVIKPPTGNTVGLTLGSDTPISPSNPTLVSFPTTAGGATYTLASAGAITGSVEVTFA